MAVAKTFTSDLDPTRDGVALTYVVPARRCNLRCAFCFIDQRREGGPSLLAPRDYSDFISHVADWLPVRVSGLQGIEPLLPESWAYSEEILRTSNRLCIPTSMVTNGTYLRSRIDALDALGLKDITVSLDAVSAADHDRIRGVPGSFESTVSGIQAALKYPRFADRLAVASVVLPRRAHLLSAMPAFLADMGVRYFGVTPLIKVGRSIAGGFVQENESLLAELDRLQELCDRVGIKFVIDDELGLFREQHDGLNRLMIHRLARPERLIRLTPSGAVSCGLDVLKEVDASTAHWNPGTASPMEVLRQLGFATNVSELAQGKGRCAA
jgi:MoaA/NifB/PqqE/SkfB family radical SAM enzyme